jgi:hypothetical protein
MPTQILCGFMTDAAYSDPKPMEQKMTKTRGVVPPARAGKIDRLPEPRKIQGTPKTGEKDRRAMERYRLKEALAYEPSIDRKKRGHASTAMAINVSNGGVCFQTEQPLSLHQIIRVALPVKGGKASSPTLAEVCSVNETQGRYRIGLRFLF